MGGNAKGGSSKGDKKEEGEVMDTPDRSKTTQIAMPITKSEESPVFNFLNNLSPIKQVKSIYITQTINPLSFASIPSVFTSPHVSSHKESRFLRRYQIADPSKPEFSSDEGSNADTSKANAAPAAKISDEKRENVESRTSDSAVAGDQSFDCSKLVVEFVEDPVDGCGGIDSSTLVSSASNACQRGKGMAVVEVNQIDQNKASASCEWENLISDIVFESPNDGDSNKRLSDPGTNFYATIENDIQNMQSLCVLSSGDQVVEGSEVEQHLLTQPADENEINENAEACDMIIGPSMINPGEKIDYGQLSSFYRGMRRRCLIFEMGGVRRTHLNGNLGSDSSLLQSDGNTSSNDQKTVSVKTANDSSRHVLPGIGLHLNALAATPKDYSNVNHDSSASGRLLIGPNSSVTFQPPTTGQEPLENDLPASSIREIDRTGNAIIPMEDMSQGLASGYAANEETGPSSPKKKKRKGDPVGEGEACKRCNCKKSKCLKLYCECFAAGVYCVEPCACIDCFNKPIHEDTVLATRKQIESRNPLAFAPKVIRTSDSLAEAGDDSSKTPASARHKRGCNCKKSGCLKKYCECYQSGVGCSINCRCEGCKNAFGRKDGSTVIPMEVDPEDDETDINEKSSSDRSQKAISKPDLVQSMDPVVPATPLRAIRQSVHIPFSSKKKLPRVSFPSTGSSYNRHGLPALPLPPSRTDECKTAREEIPEFLEEGSPVASIKLSSPNQKRVSPPHSAEGSSPSLRSSRKLILQSIPSFPSLSSQNQ